jgi:hypothetical protein
MLLHRVRAIIQFQQAQGLATWCRDNMAVRFAQAVHIRPGEMGDEPAVNEVVAAPNSRQVFRCDLPLMDEAHAIDAVATLSDANVLGQSEPTPAADRTAPSWVERHVCDHAEDDRTGCVVVDRREGPL